jgi:tetratricopeptide (TPR) repeat protein
MPSHTFTRVGFWQESIDTNILSAAAARRERTVGEELHATDYQMYAYLQTAQDAAARNVLDSLPEIVTRGQANVVQSAAPVSANAFALAAIPARYALERQAWAEAAALPIAPGGLPYTDAMTHFARALGASHQNDVAAAKASVDALERLHDKLTQMNDTYWAEQVEIERRGAAAWTAFAEGRNAEALSLMRSAAEVEDGTEKNAVTPGPLAPARELLGEMLLQTHEPALALKEFQATLKKEPNRFRAMYGAAHAALLAGDRATAKTYYEQLLKICVKADQPGRAELAEARANAAKPSAQ